MQRRKFLRVFVFLLLFIFVSASTSMAKESFQQWITNFYPQAQKAGISKATYDAVFLNVKTVDKKVLKKANYQPEFTTEIWDYLDTRVNSRSVAIGRKMASKYKSVLDRIEKDFSVSRYVILAIWSMESNYGAVLDKKHLFHYVPEALATLAYADPKRAKFAKAQLIATLKMVQNKNVSPGKLWGSWAGAMGHTQFIPSSYLIYNADIDGVPGSDIWASVPDALATSANLLSKNGWKWGETWGYEVLVPRNGPQYNEDTKLIGGWIKKGFKRVNGKSFPRTEDKAILKLFNTTKGPGYLATKNFFVIKRYNNSDFYALAVGILADRIAGHGGMEQKWSRPVGALNLEGKEQVQTILQNKGYYDGKIDGSIGIGSRTAIKEYQKDMKLPVNGVADKDLLNQLIDHK
ncbi:MAG: lytic murein transglycosylase [Desulfotalea sp.]